MAVVLLFRISPASTRNIAIGAAQVQPARKGVAAPAPLVLGRRELLLAAEPRPYMTAPIGQTRRSLYPENEPFAFGWLSAGGPHEVYYEECGARAGKPCLILHGGPGGAINPTMRRFFDPQKWRMTLFDQRGCGRSRPNASLEDNTTWALIEDIEKLRVRLGVREMDGVRRLLGLHPGPGLRRHPSRARRGADPARRLPPDRQGARTGSTSTAPRCCSPTPGSGSWPRSPRPSAAT